MNITRRDFSTTTRLEAATDRDIARDWKPGTLKADGKLGGTEKGFRQ
jgi:hypothetical protein